MKKRSEETQTLRVGCSKVEPTIFAPLQTPFPGARDGQNLISWRRSLPLPTNPVWWGSMHAVSSYRGNRSTHKQTYKQTGPITIHCAAAIARSVKVLLAHSSTTSAACLDFHPTNLGLRLLALIGGVRNSMHPDTTAPVHCIRKIPHH